MNSDAILIDDPELDQFVAAVLGRKAMGVVVLDVRHLTSVADFFIICSGRSNRQVSAIAEHIHTSLKASRIQPLSVEGKREGHWVLMDYGTAVIHVFYEPVRRFYDLEGLWVDARRVTTPALERQAAQDRDTQAEDDDFDPIDQV
jgi:ribosome-associated protein